MGGVNRESESGFVAGIAGGSGSASCGISSMIRAAAPPGLGEAASAATPLWAAVVASGSSAATPLAPSNGCAVASWSDGVVELAATPPACATVGADYPGPPVDEELVALTVGAGGGRLIFLGRPSSLMY